MRMFFQTITKAFMKYGFRGPHANLPGKILYGLDDPQETLNEAK
jgi:hypothetical protein